MPEGGKVTPISPGIVARVAQAARFIISGNTSNWFPAGQPLTPQAPVNVKGRQFDYETYVNTNYTPRSSEAISFHDLRGPSADTCDILSSPPSRPARIRWRRWTGTSASRRTTPTSARPRPAESSRSASTRLRSSSSIPTGSTAGNSGSAQLLDDMFIIDAPCLYKRRDRKGPAFTAWRLIDGATIKILLDDTWPTAPFRPILPISKS